MFRRNKGSHRDTVQSSVTGRYGIDAAESQPRASRESARQDDRQDDQLQVHLGCISNISEHRRMSLERMAGNVRWRCVRRHGMQEQGRELSRCLLFLDVDDVGFFRPPSANGLFLFSLYQSAREPKGCPNVSRLLI